MNDVRKIGKRLLSMAGLRVSRSAPNRFSAMSEVLDHLGTQGYRPRAIIDGGANVGTWPALAHRRFPEASLFLVEPQPGCGPALRELERDVHSASVPPVALAAPGTDRVTMVDADSSSTHTGAWISHQVDPSGAGLNVPATTLDHLFASPTSSNIFAPESSSCMTSARCSHARAMAGSI